MGIPTEWKGSDNSSMPYNDWCNNGPDNSGGNEHCSLLRDSSQSASGYCWADLDCNFSREKVICVFYAHKSCDDGYHWDGATQTCIVTPTTSGNDPIKQQLINSGSTWETHDSLGVMFHVVN